MNAYSPKNLFYNQVHIPVSDYVICVQFRVTVKLKNIAVAYDTRGQL